MYQPQNDTLGLHEWLGLNLTRSTGEFAVQSQYVEVRSPHGFQAPGGEENVVA